MELKKRKYFSIVVSLILLAIGILIIIFIDKIIGFLLSFIALFSGWKEIFEWLNKQKWFKKLFEKDKEEPKHEATQKDSPGAIQAITRGDVKIDQSHHTYIHPEKKKK